MKQSVFIVPLIIFFSCCENKSKEKATEENKAEVETSAAEVTISAQQYKSANIELGMMQYRNLSSAIKCNGRLSLPPQNKATVSTPYGGIMKEIKVATGQQVNKGAILAIIENSDIIQLQQDYFENASHLEYIKTDFERQKNLQKDNITSQKHFQETEADYKSTVAKDNALKAKLKLLKISIEQNKSGYIVPYLTITAPISGYVQDITTNIGAFAEPNSMLFEIINNSDLHIDLQVFEKDVRKISIHQKVNFTFINSQNNSEQDSAIIFAIDKEFNPQTQAIIAHAKIQKPKGIMLPGMYVDARIVIDKLKALSVKDEAIVSQGDEHFIFIAEESKKENDEKKSEVESKEENNELRKVYTFKKITVTLGSSDLGFTGITPTEEINNDAQIVIKGAYALLSEMNKGGEEE